MGTGYFVRLGGLIRGLGRLLMWRATPLSLTMVGVQLYYLYEVFVGNDLGGFAFTWGALGVVLWSFVTVSVSFRWIPAMITHRLTAVVASLVMVVAYGILAGYHFGSNDFLEWSLVRENIGEAFSSEALDVMRHAIDTRSVVYALIIVGVFAIMEWRYRAITGRRKPFTSWSARVMGLCIFAVSVWLPITPADPLMHFYKSIGHYYRNAQSLYQPIPADSYPFLRPLPSQFPAKNPTVYLIILESFNASVLGATAPDGRAYTPFLNALMTAGVSVSPFYGNAIQTAKGHFATLFSFMPGLSGKTMVKYPDLRIDSIATALKTRGYVSHVFAAHNNPTFDNTQPFLQSHGFDTYAVAADYTTSTDPNDRLRWGTKDAVFFRDFFAFYDAVHVPNQREYYTILTVANHFPFNSMQASDKTIYPQPTSIRQDYANSVALVDEGIRVFINTLKERGEYHNSLIIITGDHAFPLGEHGNYHLEAGYHEDSFRIPLLILWPEVLAPQRITRAHSQLDIAPTITDLMGVSLPDSTFMGQSIFSKSPPPLIPLIQPYAKQFSIVDYPIKYRFAAKSNRLYAYDLSRDPMETTSMLPDLSDEQRARYDGALQGIYRANYAIKHNRIRPSTHVLKPVE
jgi:hypothetical protein